MKKVQFKNEIHKEKFEAVWGRLDEKKRTEKNRAIVYLISWVDTEKPGVLDLIFDYETVSVSPWHYLKDCHTRMTQNAIFLIHSFALYDFDYNLSIVDASHWNRCFVEAFCIYYDTCYAEMKDRWNEIVKMDAERNAQ